MRRTKEDAEKTRQAILASAIDIFCEKGYSKTTFDEIAKRINLTKGAVYWYFRNKPDIVAALINEHVQKYVENLHSFFNRENTDFSSIIQMLLYNNEQIRTNPKFYKYLFFITCQMEWSEAIINKILPGIEETKKSTRKLFVELLDKLKAEKKIKDDVDTGLIGEILMAMYGGMLEGYFTKRLNNNFDELVVKGFNLIYNGIKTEGFKNEN